MFRGTCRHKPSFSRDHVERQDIVARRAERAHQPAIAAAQREAGDADFGIGAAWNGKTECLRRMVHVPPGDAGLGPHDAAIGHDANAFHARHVDHQPVIAQCGSGAGVAAAAYCHRQGVVLRKTDACNDVGHVGASRNQQRPPVDAAVPDATGVVEPRIGAPDQRSAKRPTEAGYSRGGR